ncbi:Dak phosphatase, partial [mine drainage metagenome]
MNPSTEEILLAIEEVPGDNVIVLPNNTNVTPVAQIAAEISKKCVRVIPTRGVVEGLSALVEFDPMVSIDENFESMSECAKRVTVAEITQAVRDYSDESGLVHAGDFIGLSRQGLVAVSKSLEDTVVDT